MADKTLLVYLHGIGDHLMATPAIHEFKKQHPHSELYLLALDNPLFKDLWKYNPDITAVLQSSLRKNPRYGHPFFWLHDFWRILADIRRWKNRLHFSHVYFLVHFFMPAKIYRFLPLRRYQRHKSLIVADQLGVSLARPHYLFSLSPREQTFARRFFLQHHLIHKNVVSLHYHASSLSKSLNVAEVQNIVRHLTSLGYHVLVVSSDPLEKEVAALPGVTAYQSQSILLTAGLLSRCVAHVGVDSGIAHLAAAVGVPCFVVAMNNVWAKNSGVLSQTSVSYTFSGRRLPALLSALTKFFR